MQPLKTMNPGYDFPTFDEWVAKKPFRGLDEAIFKGNTEEEVLSMPSIKMYNYMTGPTIKVFDEFIIAENYYGGSSLEELNANLEKFLDWHPKAFLYSIQQIYDPYEFDEKPLKFRVRIGLPKINP